MSTNCKVTKLMDSVNFANPENLYYEIMNLISCSGTPSVRIFSNSTPYTPYFIEENGVKTEYNSAAFTSLPTNGGRLWVPKYNTTRFENIGVNSTSQSPIDAMNISDFFSSDKFPNLIFIAIPNPQGKMDGNIMSFSDRPFTKIQLAGSKVDITGELKDFISAQCAFRTDGSLEFILFSYVTFDGKRGDGGTNRGDVNGTVTYSSTGATVVITGGTAVKGTYEYTKATDTWVKTAD